MALKDRRTQKNKTNRVKRGGKKVGKKTKKSLRNKKRQSRRVGGAATGAATGVKRNASGKRKRADNTGRGEQRRPALIARDSWMSPVQPRISKYLNADVADPKEFNTNSNGNSNYENNSDNENNSDSNKNENNEDDYENDNGPNPPPPKKSTDKYADKTARAHHGG